MLGVCCAQKMQMIRQPILFVSRDSAPSGAPLLLLHLLRWLRENTKFHFTVLLNRSGSLTGRFAELAPVVLSPAIRGVSRAGRIIEPKRRECRIAVEPVAALPYQLICFNYRTFFLLGSLLKRHVF